jgi:IstB-like ATP binding protein
MAFEPSLDRERVLTLAELQFVDRREVVHFLGPPGTGKSHLALALGVEAVKAGSSAYFATLADIVGTRAMPNARVSCASASIGSAAPRCSSSTRSATCRSCTAAAISSSSSSMPATKRAR